MQVPEGHRRLLMNYVSKIRTPKRKETPTLGDSPQQQKFPSLPPPQVKRETFETPRTRRNIEVRFPGPRSKILSPVERFIKAKEDEISDKNTELKAKKEELYVMTKQIESALQEIGKTGQKCSNCHKRNHTVRSCVEEKCQSAFSCGDISKHSDEKMVMQEKKRAISALETSVRKLNQELTARMATYDHVNQSVNKRIEEMLCEEFPSEYIENQHRNWLKIQRDVSIIKKHVKGDRLPSKEIVKNILERKDTTVTEISPFSHESKETAMQQKLKSLGIHFHKKESPANYTNSASVSNDLANVLEPRSCQEEIEQIRMATQLSLHSTSHSTRTEQRTNQNIETDINAASILLSLGQHKDD